MTDPTREELVEAPTPALRVISLGAGVQSSTMALMAAHKEIGPMPHEAIFADTGGEPAAVYEWLGKLEALLPFPVTRVSHGNLGDAVGTPRPKGQFLKVEIPAFVKNRDGSHGGLLVRTCTRDYKIRPIQKRMRQIVGHSRRKIPDWLRAEQWIGISVEEAHRMKPSRESWINNRWSLIEQNMSRADCLAWMQRHGYPQPPRSSCVFCPFRGRTEWESLSGMDREAAIRVDEALRSQPAERYRSSGELYVHRSYSPLKDALETATQEPDLFGNECSGVCGV